MGIALALLSALSYGVSDVIGGLAARRLSPVRVALIGQIGGLCITGVVLLGLHSSPQLTDLIWGAGSGIGTGLAMAFLFRGLRHGSMSVVVPLSAVGGVAIPVLVGAVALGERPPALGWLGVAIAIPALWLIGRGSGGSLAVSRASVLDGLAASGGIAIQYLCLARSDTMEAGLWPILSGRVTAIAAVLIAAVTFMREPVEWRPQGAPHASVLALSLGAGALAAAALSAYLFALRTEFITTTVVLSSLYPVVPVLVGLLLLSERLHLRQSVGLLAALGATVLIATS
ncbi:EamA family transporter [Ornithinicoccus halotolerans]|uniref:EamA family transporter n=1 Tax=Ornithinicoccus halotolerans TaxID=1748220 RepID=UPI001296CEA4|nr:EamA family transporter [Ornithinicoccus halotolerans]